MSRGGDCRLARLGSLLLMLLVLPPFTGASRAAQSSGQDIKTGAKVRLTGPRSQQRNDSTGAYGDRGHNRARSLNSQRVYERTDSYYNDRCQWLTAYKGMPRTPEWKDTQCTIWYFIPSGMNEGVTPVMLEAVYWHYVALQIGCRFLFEYSKDIPIGTLKMTDLLQFPARGHGTDWSTEFKDRDLQWEECRNRRLPQGEWCFRVHIHVSTTVYYHISLCILIILY